MPPSIPARRYSIICANICRSLAPRRAAIIVNAATFLDYPDAVFNELGARGIGEIGLAGVAAAITNAVNHATGRRIRHLPVMIENLLKS